MLAEYQLTGAADPDRATTGLVAQARAGDGEAFRVIFLRHSRPVLAYLFNMLGDRCLAEELVQETFVRAYRRLDTILDDSRLATWLFGIAHNVAREAIKKKYRLQRRVPLEEVETRELEDGRPRPDSRLLGTEVEQAVERALFGLKEDQRTVVALKLLQRLSYQEIAEITGSSVGKLKTDLHRARLEIRRKLRLYLGDFPGLTGDRGGS